MRRRLLQSISLAVATLVAAHDDLLRENKVLFQEGNRRNLESTSTELNEDCGRNSYVDVYVLVEHEMWITPKIADKPELSLLKRGFQNTYNTLNGPNGKNEACDESHLRYAHLPEIEMKEIYYANLPLGQSGRPARRNFFYKLRISGKDLSQENSRMFEFEEQGGTSVPPPVSEQNEGTGEEGEATANRTLFAVPEQIMETAKKAVCQCPKDYTSNRAPLEGEFTRLFNKFIRNQLAKGKLTNVGQAIHVTEFEVVDCRPATIEYESNVTVELSGPSVENELNLNQLGSDFADSYNEVANFFCDPCFRVVTGVTLEEIVEEEEEGNDGERALTLAEETTNAVQKKKKRQRAASRKKKRLLSKVKTQCRKKSKCKRKKKLFDDVSDDTKKKAPTRAPTKKRTTTNKAPTRAPTKKRPTNKAPTKAPTKKRLINNKAPTKAPTRNNNKASTNPDARRILLTKPQQNLQTSIHRSHYRPVKRGHGRRVQDNVCFCPTQPAGYRGQDSDEFQQAYDKIARLTDRRLAVSRVEE